MKTKTKWKLKNNYNKENRMLKSIVNTIGKKEEMKIDYKIKIELTTI